MTREMLTKYFNQIDGVIVAAIEVAEPGEIVAHVVAEHAYIDGVMSVIRMHPPDLPITVLRTTINLYSSGFPMETMVR